jgi:hypothetical protein
MKKNSNPAKFQQFSKTATTFRHFHDDQGIALAFPPQNRSHQNTDKNGRS